MKFAVWLPNIKADFRFETKNGNSPNSKNLDQQMGLKGADLRDFVTEQKELEREERNRLRQEQDKQRERETEKRTA